MKGERTDSNPPRDLTLDELEGVVWGEPTYDSHLVLTCHRLRRKPIGEFTVEDLRLMIGQKIGLAYLLPLALEHLEANPFAAGDFYPGDLLEVVLRAEAKWADRPELADRMREIARRALARLEQVKPVDWIAGEMPDPEEPGECEKEYLEDDLRAVLSRLEAALKPAPR
jgi:hypothetical protein